MFYKGLIFDLDNTIYCYDDAHKIALEHTLGKYFPDCLDDAFQVYGEISSQLKSELGATASSHNRAIYFKQLCEYFGLNYSTAILLNEYYWQIFYSNMKCYQGCPEFIRWNRELGVKIGILTDFQTEHQLKKLQSLGLLDDIDFIVTSEEVGREKPSTCVFYQILNKMNLSPDEVIITGDNFIRDIKGGINVGLYGFWFNNDALQTDIVFNKRYVQFNSYGILHKLLLECCKQIENLVELSKFCGERFDLVQAGGGNSSVKIGEWMIIKASGYSLADVARSSGYSLINLAQLLVDLRKNCAKHNLSEYLVMGKDKPSIETYMHAFLKQYTIHLHPIQINRILVQKDAPGIISHLFPESLFIEYVAPGLKLSNAILDKYTSQELIILQNHGIIITSDNYSDIYHKLELVLDRCEQYLGIDLTMYRNTNKISSLFYQYCKAWKVTLMSCDSDIINYLNTKLSLFRENRCYPDAVVYCGHSTLFLDNLNIRQLDDYCANYKYLPKIIVYGGRVYFVGDTLKQCLNIESVFKANLLIMDSDCLDKSYLKPNEIDFLVNWDAEKYRLSINK